LEVITLTEPTFDDSVTAESQPVLVDFWTEDCAPCRVLAPILDDIADEYPEKLRIGKVKLDNAPNLARRFEIMTIPTLIVFVDGHPAKRITDIGTKRQLVQELQEFLS
jgi:thioredoxin 1